MDDETLFQYLYANNNHLRSYAPLRDDGFAEEGLVTSSDLEKEQEKYSGIPRGAPEEGLKADDCFRSISKKRKHKYSEAEMEEIRKSCETTIVHDFSENDFYHMSDEDRAELDTLSEMRPQMSTLSTVYRRVDTFIQGMRTVMKAIRILEKKFNVLYTTDEFYQMLSEGRVIPVGFSIPRLRTKNKYDPGVLARYIEDETLDPSSLLTERERMRRDKILFADEELQMETQEEFEEKMARLFTPEEISRIEEIRENPPTIEATEIPDEYVSGYSLTRSFFGREQQPKFKTRSDKLYAKTVHRVLNHIESSPGFSPDPNASIYDRTYASSASLLLGGSFEPEEKLPNPVDKIRYGGSLRDTDSFELYKIQLENAILDSNVGQNSYQTNQSVRNRQMFDQMEKAGINVVELRRTMNVPGGISSDQDNYFLEKRLLDDNIRLETSMVSRILGMNDEPKFLKIVNKAEREAAEEEKGLVEWSPQ